jgi:hypothetical protein
VKENKESRENNQQEEVYISKNSGETDCDAFCYKKTIPQSVTLSQMLLQLPSLASEQGKMGFDRQNQMFLKVVYIVGNLNTTIDILSRLQIVSHKKPFNSFKKH